MNYYAFPNFIHEICKTNRKGNYFGLGIPGFSINHATAHKHYSYESQLRIWNPELFHILTRASWLLKRHGGDIGLLEQQLTNGSGVGDREVQSCCRAAERGSGSDACCGTALCSFGHRGHGDPPGAHCRVVGSEWERHRVSRREWRGQASTSGFAGAPKRVGQMSSMVVRRVCSAAMRSPRVLPLRHSDEHVSCDEVVSVGSGLFKGRFGLWAKNGPLYISCLRFTAIRVIDQQII